MSKRCIKHLDVNGKPPLSTQDISPSVKGRWKKTIESSLPVGIWLKVVSFIKFGVATTAESSIVLTISGFGKHLHRPRKFCTRRCFSYKALFDKMLSWLDRSMRTSNPPPFANDLEKSKRFCQSRR